MQSTSQPLPAAAGHATVSATGVPASGAESETVDPPVGEATPPGPEPSASSVAHDSTDEDATGEQSGPSGEGPDVTDPRDATERPATDRPSVTDHPGAPGADDSSAVAGAGHREDVRRDAPGADAPEGEEPAPAPGADAPDTSAMPDEPRPIGVGVEPTGRPAVDALLARLADVDHLGVAGHLGVYEDVHRGLRDALTALDQAPGPQPSDVPHDSRS